MSMTKPNLVIYELVPEQCLCIEVGPDLLSIEQLELVQGAYANSTTCTEEQELILGIINEQGTVLEGSLDASRFHKIIRCGFLL